MKPVQEPLSLSEGEARQGWGRGSSMGPISMTKRVLTSLGSREGIPEEVMSELRLKG